MKPQKKRRQRRERDLEKDINTNGMDYKGGQFRVFQRGTRTYVTPPVSWEEATKVWREVEDTIILQYKK